MHAVLLIQKKLMSTINENRPEENSWVIACEDCLDAAKKLTGSCRLAVFDSPYNFGMDYPNYDDKKSQQNFLSQLQQWLTAVASTLTEDGSLWVFSPEEWVSRIDIYCQDTLNLFLRRHIIWAFTFGQAAAKNFTRSHCHILYLTKSKKNFIYNRDAVAILSARQAVYKDKRANPNGKNPDDVWVLRKNELAEAIAGNESVWLENRICGTYKERQPHISNQIPLAIYRRIVSAVTYPNDLVFDPFGGSFGLGVVARQLGRRYYGCDISEDFVRIGTDRLRSLIFLNL